MHFYECTVVTKDSVTEEGLTKILSLVHETVALFKGEVLLEDRWGTLRLAQPYSNGTHRGNFSLLFLKVSGEAVKEISRKLKIAEEVLRFLVLKADPSLDQETLLKTYCSPFSKKYRGSVVEEEEDLDGMGMGQEKDRKKFSRKKSCWFTAKKIQANWKDPQTYRWLINEFGKISPARVSGISRLHQTISSREIKRARQLGVASSLSGFIASPL